MISRRTFIGGCVALLFGKREPRFRIPVNCRYEHVTLYGPPLLLAKFDGHVRGAGWRNHRWHIMKGSVDA
jgi:hypothetical protein